MVVQVPRFEHRRVLSSIVPEVEMMNQEQQTLVNRLEEAGISLRRFIGVGEDKSPREPSDWQNNLKTPEELNGYPAWGIVGREGLVLVDTDDEETAKFIEENLPATFVSISPHRKLPHFYFNVLNGEVPNRVLKLPGETKGGGEIRAQNQYLVAPGSVVKFGKYEILRDNPIARLDCPAFMRKIEPLLGVDTEQKLTEAEIKGGVDAGTRHHYGIRMATYLIVVQKFDRDSAIQEMNRWNELNDPPMSSNDLTRMVDYAISKHGVAPPPGPVELGGLPPSTDITDKIISDYILGRRDFYCDAEDPNTVLYTWHSGYWQRGIYEGVINKELSTIFYNEKSRGRMQLDKTIIFIRGVAMNNTVQEAPPSKISFKNGLLDIKTMELGEHDKSLFIVNQIPHDYNPDAKCPKWEAWLADTVHAEDVPFLQEWVGYNFYRGVPEAAFLILTGSGQNGKTVFMILFLDTVGRRNNSTISLPALSYDVFSRAQLDQKLSNISDDLGNTMIKNAGYLKEVSSGSEINAQHKFGHPFDFIPYSKITYACNEPPEIRDQSDAIKMRLRVVKFPYTFSKDPHGEQKPARDREELIMELREEIPGIINWAIVGLKRFLENNSRLSASMSTEETWKFYQRKSLPVLSFVDECLVSTENDDDKISIDKMFEYFTTWLDMNEIKLKVTRRKMIADLKEEGITTRRKRSDDQKSLFYGLVCTVHSFLQTRRLEEKEAEGIRFDKNRAHPHTLDDFPPLEEGEDLE